MSGLNTPDPWAKSVLTWFILKDGIGSLLAEVTALFPSPWLAMPIELLVWIFFFYLIGYWSCLARSALPSKRSFGAILKEGASFFCLTILSIIPGGLIFSLSSGINLDSAPSLVIPLISIPLLALYFSHVSREGTGRSRSASKKG